MTNEEPSENKEEPQEKESEEPAKPKRTRKPVPKFEAEMLTDPNKGMAALYRKMQKLDDSQLVGDKERLAWLMRTYQQWLYQLFPADFRDMCWALPDRKGVKATVRDFVFDMRGRERYAGTPSASDQESDHQDDPPEN